MAHILHIETATDVCSVAIADSGRPILERQTAEPRQHISNLSELIEEVLLVSSIAHRQLAAIAVSRGPGSYTGLRVGYATAKGLCFGLGIPLIEVDTLYSLAWGMKRKLLNDLDVIVPMIDARRNEVYSAHYNGDLKEIKPAHAWILSEGDLKATQETNARIGYCGNGAFKIRQILHEVDSHKNMFISDLSCSSSFLIAQAWNCFQKKIFADLAYAEPLYLKPPNITKRKKTFF